MKTTINGYGRLEDVIDAISDPVRVIGKDHQIILINNAFEKNFGNALGAKCYSVIGRSCPCDECLCVPVFDEGCGCRGERVVGNRNYSVTSAPFYGDSDACSGAVEVFRDVTEYVELLGSISRINKKMTRDLNVARTLQQSMINHTIHSPDGYDIASGFFPCGEVGGDVFDVLTPEPGKLLMYVADVSGHGVMSAMITVFIKREIPAQCEKHGADLLSVLRGLFHAFSELRADESVYFTLFAVQLDIASGRLSCANMGHSVCPILRSASGEVTELCAPGDPVCSWVSEPSIGHITARLEHGGRILLYTDGVEDAGTIVRFDRHPGECARLFLNSRIQNDFDDQVILICDRK